jgi:hypothetical protein
VDKLSPFWPFGTFPQKAVDIVDNDPHVIHIALPHYYALFGGYPQIHNAY